MKISEIPLTAPISVINLIHPDNEYLIAESGRETLRMKYGPFRI
jgi:hypothetical protein